MNTNANILLLLIFFVFSCQTPNPNQSDEKQSDDKMSSFDVDDLHQRTFNYFWELADAETGLIPDRWPTESFSSIAAMGFGLTAIISGVENGYISRQQAAERVLTSLQFLINLPQGDTASGVAGYKGFYYHFLDMKTGHRFDKVELSTIDTGLLMAGILSCMSWFDGDDDTEKSIRRLSDALYRRVEWDWFLNENGLLSMGWHPEKGFLPAEWSGYNEAMILNILALGSPTHPVPENIWEKWTEKYEWDTFYNFEHINFGPLFGHQYSHIYIDFKGITDSYTKEKGIDYFENSRRATLANRAYCIDNPKNFKGYGENIWGLTACDGPANIHKIVDGQRIQFHTYIARGAAKGYIVDDGTITPTAAGGSIPFAPEQCLAALKSMYDNYGDNLYDTYGFKDAFNPTFANEDNPEGWFNPDYIGIDQGPILLMLDNHRSQLVWSIMKKNPYIIAGLKKAGFTGGWLDEVTKTN